MWERVCILLKKWQDEGQKLYPVSVNISRISMYNPQIVEELVDLTEKYHVPKHYLNLEITESAYMTNPEMMKRIIGELRKEGFVILMDDFGSGYSSLNTLKDIDMDILKIDMRFLPTGQENTKSEKILASVIRMAGWVGMPVIVEGVETREQKEFLESIGCTYVQGYFYARPMPVPEYEQLMREQAKKVQPLTERNHNLLKEFDAIWASDSRTGALLKSVSVPYAVFEYSNEKIDLLRVNQCYTEEFGTGSLDKYMFTQEYYKLQSAIDETISSDEGGECECLFIMKDGSSRWYEIRLSILERWKRPV